MKRTLTTEAAARNVRARGFLAQMQRVDRLALVDAIDRENVAELERAAIAARIKQARTEAGLTQEEMAEAIGVIDRTYQNYESVTKPRTPWGLMSQIATITGKTTEWLIHGERETPDLSLIQGVAKEQQLDDIVERFSRRVDEVEATLRGVEDAITQQQKILERIETLVLTLPSDDTTRRLIDELRGRGAA